MTRTAAAGTRHRASPEYLLDPVDDDLRQHTWHLNGGYMRGRIDGVRIYQHQVVAGRMGLVGITDHINGNRSDNRRSNLRSASVNDNVRNQPGHADRVYSRYKGVTIGKHGEWRAQITIDGRTHGLGSYDTEEDAARAYDKAARFHFGEFARCNFDGDEAEHYLSIARSARIARSKYGILGVSFYKPTGKYRAYRTGQKHGKFVSLGHFDTLEEAKEAARATQP